MKKKNTNFFTSKEFNNDLIKYGFFTRNGGFSSKPFNKLNCNLSSEDNLMHVNQNINQAKKELGLEKTKIKFINQVHGNHIEFITEKNIEKKIIADGIITQKNNISLAILTADCAPVFLINLKNRIITALHIGWKGCLNDIIEKAILKIKKIDHFTNNTISIVGPCLNKDNFEVDEVFKSEFLQKNINYKNFFKQNKNSKKIFFDMRKLIDSQLRNLAISNIFHVDKDTYRDKSLFFSHRRSTHNLSNITGRMINIIGFSQENIG